MTVHPSEHQVGRVKFCKSCARPHMFPRYQAGPRELPTDEHWGPVKIATFVVFTFAFIWSLAFLGAALS